MPANSRPYSRPYSRSLSFQYPGRREEKRREEKGTPGVDQGKGRGIEDMDQLIIMALALAAIIAGGWVLRRHR